MDSVKLPCVILLTNQRWRYQNGIRLMFCTHAPFCPRGYSPPLYWKATEIAFRRLNILKRMVVSGMIKLYLIPEVAATGEESVRTAILYCANEQFDDVIKCDYIRAFQSNIRRHREREDMWNCVLGLSQVHCN